MLSAFYYLRIVKIMYFDDVIEPLDVPVSREMKAVMAASAILVVFFIVYPSPIIETATAAAATLLP